MTGFLYTVFEVGELPLDHYSGDSPNMSTLSEYQSVLDSCKNLLACDKRRMKLSASYHAMSPQTHTTRRRAAASDRLTDACFELDKAKDLLHKNLVDAGLESPRDRESYETRLLSHACGFGHSITFKYTPPLPKCYQ